MDTPTGILTEAGEPLSPSMPVSRRLRRAMERQAAKQRPRGVCQFPNCGKVFSHDPEKPNACPNHRKLIADVIFIMNRVGGKPTVQEEAEAAEQGPQLFIPKPGMADQAIKEALKKPKGGP